jgi:coenzyme F420-reducing hydrogenase beta subunit
MPNRTGSSMMYCGTCHVSRPLADFIGKRDPEAFTKQCIKCRTTRNRRTIAQERLSRAFRELYAAAILNARPSSDGQCGSGNAE